VPELEPENRILSRPRSKKYQLIGIIGSGLGLKKLGPAHLYWRYWFIIHKRDEHSSTITWRTWIPSRGCYSYSINIKKQFIRTFNYWSSYSTTNWKYAWCSIKTKLHSKQSQNLIKAKPIFTSWQIPINERILKYNYLYWSIFVRTIYLRKRE